MMDWLGSCHSVRNALKLNILKLKIQWLYDASVMRIKIKPKF